MNPVTVPFLPFLLQQGESGGGPSYDMFVIIAGFILIMYFVVIRPTRKQDQKRREMLSRVKKNDKVLTTGGIFGVVVSVRDEEIVLKIDEAQNVKVRVARNAISEVILPEGDGSSDESSETAAARRKAGGEKKR